ncbi:hypothetical protein [Flaviflexus massiliensis]|uniref:hypothetical protein n=1 Tax=Flaviflexus massiliensis TaxID=1522309 RepID=UPI0011C7AA52|nr:hypothetical protein [Flaviflexus massiliensis]
MEPVPMKIGLYYFEKVMTTQSDPVVLTILPGHIRVEGDRGVLLDTPAQAATVKYGRLVGTIEIRTQRAKYLFAALGTASSQPHSPEQIREVAEAQQRAAEDPGASTIELSQISWAGQQTSVDGSYGGGMKSSTKGDAGNQKKIGKIVTDALLAVGVQKA